MENKNKLLKRLIKRNEELQPIVFKSFKTEKELDRYTEKIKKEVDEYYDNQEQIELLEWELKSPEEQEKAKKRDRFLTLKAKGEPFDLSEFEDLNEY